MIELTCGCLPDEAYPVGVGKIRAKSSINMSGRQRIVSKAKLGSPVKKRYKQCLPKLSIASAVGQGPIYDISIDPLEIISCFNENYNYNYNGYSYNGNRDVCKIKDGQITQEYLDFIVNHGSAEIEYKIGVEPTYHDSALGGEKLWAFPDAVKRNHEKKFDLSYFIASLELPPQNQTPKVLDSKLSADGDVYAFAYLNPLGNGEIGVGQKPPQSCDEARGLPQWAVDDDLSFADEPAVPQLFVAIFKKETVEGEVTWTLANKIATGFYDFSADSDKIIFGALAISEDGNTVAVSNQEEDSIFPNNGRVKIYRYNSADDNYVRIDQFGYDPTLKSVDAPKTYQRNYTGKFRCPEIFFAKREDTELAMIGKPLFNITEEVENTLEIAENYDEISCSNTENFGFRIDENLGVIVARDYRVQDRYILSIKDDKNRPREIHNIHHLNDAGSLANEISNKSEFVFTEVLPDNTERQLTAKYFYETLDYALTDNGISIIQVQEDNTKTYLTDEITSKNVKDNTVSRIPNGKVVTVGNIQQKQFDIDINDMVDIEISNAKKLFSNFSSYVALKEDGTAVPYGSDPAGGSSPFLCERGSIISDKVDLSNIRDISATKRAYAAIKTDGSVVSWGDIEFGADNEENRFNLLDSVSSLHPRLNYFAAINSNGSVSTWGKIDRKMENVDPNELDPDNAERFLNKDWVNIDPSRPNRSDTAHRYLYLYDQDVAGYLSLQKDQGADITLSRDYYKFTKIISNPYASVALREDGIAVAWGDTLHGGRPYRDVFETQVINTTEVALANYYPDITSSFETNQLRRIAGSLPVGVEVGSFIRLYNDAGSNGEGDYKVIAIDGDLLTLENLDGSSPNFYAVSAFFQVSEIVAVNLGLGHAENDVLNFVSKSDLRDIETVVSNYYAFAAIKKDGTLISWGLKGHGGDHPDLELAEGETVVSISSSVFAFAALTSTGRVIAWGKQSHGGDSTFNIASSDGDVLLNDTNNPVTEIYSGRVGFMAVRQDKSVVVWGNPSLSYGIRQVGPLAVGLYGKRDNYGLGFSMDMDKHGNTIAIGSKRKSFLNNEYTGSVRLYHRYSGDTTYARYGSTLNGETSRNDGRIGFGRTVKINRDASRLFVEGLTVETIQLADGSYENKTFNAIYCYEITNFDTGDLDSDGNLQNVFSSVGAVDNPNVRRILLPEGHNPNLPYINSDYGLKINNYFAIDASGSTIAVATPASGEFLSNNTSNGEVNIYRGISYQEKYPDHLVNDFDTWRQIEEWRHDARITLDPYIEEDDLAEVSGVSNNWTYSNLFGENLSFSYDGAKLMTSSRDSVSVYEKTTTGYGEVEWSPVSRIYQYDNPEFPTHFNASQDFKNPTRYIAAHMESGGNYISTTFLSSDSQENKHYSHAIYEIDYNRPFTRQDYDTLGKSYLSHFSSTIQTSGEYSQYLLTKDTSLFNDNGTPKVYGEHQSIAIGDRSTAPIMTFAFWSDVSERSVADKVIRWGKYNVNIICKPTTNNASRDVIIEFNDTSSGFKFSFDEFNINLPQYEELFHFVVTYNRTDKYLKLWIAGEEYQTKTLPEQIQDFEVSTEKSFIGGFTVNSAQKTQILDDIRVFERVLSKNEIFKLANHRKLARRLDSYFYDINKARGNNFELEFNNSTYIDIPIPEFCTTVNYTDDCGRILDTECELDAKIKFCFYTGRPHPTYVKTFGAGEKPRSSYEISLSGVQRLLDNRLPTIKEDDQSNFDVFNDNNFFIVGAEEPAGRRNLDLFTMSGNGLFFNCHATVDLSPRPRLNGVGELINRKMSSEFGLSQILEKEGDIGTRWLDKFHGDFVDWEATDILYPAKDSGNTIFTTEFGLENNHEIYDRYFNNHDSISIYESGLLFFDENNQPQRKGFLFDSINEGVFVGGDYRTAQGHISDDAVTYIQASAVNTEFEGTFGFYLTDPVTSPRETRLRMRLSGPVKNFESEISPKFYFSNIAMKNASGETIVTYPDFWFIGDSDQYGEDPGYTTYSLAPTANASTYYQWQNGYRNLDGPSGYIITFDVRSEDRGEPYKPSAFDFGWAMDNDYEQGSEEFNEFYSVSGYNPTLRISAIEIYNSGRIVPYREDFVGCYLLGQEAGKRFERIIKPTKFLFNTFDTNIHPALSGISHPSGWLWRDNTSAYTNEDCKGADELLKIIQNDSSDSWITSDHVHEDNGKLILQFGLTDSDDYYLFDPGQFKSAFGSMFSRWFDPIQKIYNKEEKEYPVKQSFFEYDSIVLRVLASKNADARDYSLDIVGYSEDCLMNNTPRIGGFLQNVSGEFVYNYGTRSLDEYYPQGVIPQTSGFLPVDDFALAGESTSDKNQYFESWSTNNDGGDHYALSNYPVVDSTEFKWYEVKLKTYDDDVRLGRSTNYRQSSFLEKLFLDIYALPSGANIAGIELAVRHKLSAGLEMLTEGGVNDNVQEGRSESSLYPVSMGSSDLIINAGSGYQPLSLIEEIPHAYRTPDTIKTNYAKRWRGLDGVTSNPFDIRQFDYSFDRGRRLKRPLLGAWIDFSDIDDDYPSTVTLNSNHAFENKSAVLLENGSPVSPELYENIGARFRNQDMFTTLAPGFSSDYRTADWTALSNGVDDYTDSPLYGKIADSYDRVVRFGNKTTATIGDVNPASGAAFFFRFIPDINASGENQDNFYDKSTIASLTQLELLNQTGVFIGYSGGYLFASGQNIDGDTASVIDTIPFTDYQYPLSVLVTYSEHLDNKLRLYTDHEGWSGEFDHLRDTSTAVELEDYDEKLRVGFGGDFTSGLPMLLTEFGFSHMVGNVSGANIVNENAVLNHKQITATQFFSNIRQKYFDPDETYVDDTNMFWSYVDENTAMCPSAEWYLGAFRGCDFNWQFDSINNKKLGKRSYTTERDDHITFYLSHDGTPYIDNVDNDLPETLNSGLAYHTQVENDFLRFHLSDATDNFYSIKKRISKSIPLGYDFAESALVVDLVYEHHSSGDLIWECENETGPKVIVSLYTRNQEPYYETEEPNWGLVNRHSHYLHRSSCLEMMQSKFTYKDYCDDSEKWALFPEETRLSEFNDKYYSKDIDQMFLQIDIAYPSGSAFTSELDIHAIHVRAEDAYVKPTEKTGTLHLNVSGAYTENLVLDLYTFGVSGSMTSGYMGYTNQLFLNTAGHVPIEDSGILFMNLSGNYSSSEYLGLLTLNKRKHDSSGQDTGDDYWQSNDYEQYIVGTSDIKGLHLFVSGTTPPTIYEGSGSLNMLTEGIGLGSEQMPLTIYNNDFESQVTGSLNLNTFGSTSGASGLFEEFNLILFNNGGLINTFGRIDDSLGLNISGVQFAGRDIFASASMPLSITAPLELPASATLPLMLDAVPEPVDSSGQLGLLLRNNGVGNYLPNIPGKLNFVWDGYNYGEGIDVADEKYTSIPANDEIRGVDLYGYGNCDSTSQDKAYDYQIEADDVIWREKKCYDGGIFRPTNTYTNIDVGYEDQYYGIRKYEDLKAVRPYFITMEVKTGDTTPIAIPRKWEEWEYGICGVGTAQGECCTPDCDQTLNFSGIKLIGDYPYLSGDISLASEFQIESGRQQGDRYGYTSACHGDLIAVGAPLHSVLDSGGVPIEDAGAVFLYRRFDEQAGKKADWYLEEKLLLPEGMRRDFVEREVGTIVTFPPDLTIGGKKWAIGQEGREFGHSVDIGNDGEKEVIVVGAPGAKWTREFPEINVSGIPVLMTIFTDKFTYNKTKLLSIRNAAKKYDLLYKYFAKPWGVAPDDWHPEIDVHILICQIYDSEDIDDLPSIPDYRKNRGAAPYWFNHLYINNLKDPDREDEDLLTEGFTKVHDKFKQMFPHNNTLYSGIPPIVGLFGDDTFSTSNKKSYLDILDKFVDFYEDYAYASGVQDMLTSTATSGYINQVFDDAFVWDEAALELMSRTLSSGNLIKTGNLKYITEGVGQQYARDDVDEFQLPPESGGRAYVFEKEFGEWNLVQEFISPLEDITVAQDEFNLMYDERNPVDRYGHSVAISENCEIISIGSPYSAETCQIFERDDTANTRMYQVMYDWLVETNDPYEHPLQDSIDRWNELIDGSGTIETAKQVYKEMSKKDKFLLRKNKNIKLYDKIYKYHYTDIQYTGTWSFIAHEFAGMSRLGYSTSVSEDGRTVVFGAPTDSFNEFDDFNVWYGGLTGVNNPENNTWASYTNAGAVRVFESRKYHDHGKAVEFYKFGNLDRSYNIDRLSAQGITGAYEKLGSYFAADNIPFERTQFDQIEIPTDAGLAFIITPEIDAASDEIIDNIKSWLALGDRTLVLVGNDPTWKEGGLYKKSNDIINKILQKLDCRMRIVPARNRDESLAGGMSSSQILDGKFNVTPAHLPQYVHNSDAIRENMYASGVADIRIDLSKDNLQALKLYSPCDPDATDPRSPDRCIPPIQHMGDLRSEWFSACFDKVEYYTGWAFHFDTENPGQQCKYYPEIVKPYIVQPDEEITPILTAAEYAPQKSKIIPASSGEEEQCTTTLSGIISTTYTINSKSYDFAEDHLSNIAFDIYDSGNQAIGNYNQINRGRFANPEKENGRDALLQGVGTDYSGDSQQQQVKVSDVSPYVTEELFPEDETSKVYIIASQLPENAWSMGLRFGDEYDPRNEDQNIVFYNNLVMIDCENRAKISQLGGWTGRTSFKDAFKDSVLKRVLETANHTVDTNVVYTNESIIPESVSVIWIASPKNAIPENYVQPIKNWMKLGNKKLIFTLPHNRDQQVVENVDITLKRFGMLTRPFFLENEAKYAIQGTDALQNSMLSDCCPLTTDEDERLQVLDAESDVIKGCPTGYKWTGTDPDVTKSTKVDKLSAIPNTASPVSLDDNETALGQDSDGFDGYAFVPIKVAGENTRVVVNIKAPLFDKVWSNPDTYWKIDGEAFINFPVEAGSGYRLFVDWVSETNNEEYEILFQMDVNDVSFTADPEGEGYSPDSPKQLGKTTKFVPDSHSVDFRVKEGKESVTVKFDTKKWRDIKDEDVVGDRPYTPRILKVAAYPLPIIETTHTTEKTINKKVYITECSGVPWYIPEREIIVPPLFRPVSTNHQKYCNPDAIDCNEFDPNLDVEDGPVIVADELEHFTNFDVGSRRSRIILVTDSSMIQGQNEHYRYDVDSPNVRLIRSFYPQRPNQAMYYDEDNVSKKGTKFEFTQKLRAPEKGSPSKYFANSGDQLLVEKFGFNGNAGELDKYTDKEDTYVLGDVTRRFTPIGLEKIKQEIERFGGEVVPEYGTYPRFSGNFYDTTIDEITHWVDSDINGGVPTFMDRTGKDYLDRDVLVSGFNGDLFGFSVDIYKNKLVVGTPFNAYNSSEIVSWSGIIDAYNANDVASGLNLSSRGGGGAAFYYERTGRGINAVDEFLPWEYKQKLKPDGSVHVGIDNATAADVTSLKGNHNLPDEFAEAFAWVPDMFGWSVAVESDFIAVGSPAHDYETLHNHIYSGSAGFVRKEFSREFDIPDHEFYDLGDAQVRDQYPGSGKMVLNNGAVYTFRHDIDNFQDRNKTWNFAQKIVAQGFSDRNTDLTATSGTENDWFGNSVALHRAKRSDSDYVMVIGSPQHKMPTSGDHSSVEISGAGAAYTYDAMLRHQPDAIPAQGSYIIPTVFGDTVGETRKGSVSGIFYQNVTGDQIVYRISGIVHASPEGSLFIEVSGYDPADQGFTSQRPYIDSIYGEYISGTEDNESIFLTTEGKAPEASAIMPLIVYNNDEEIVSSNVYGYLYNGEPIVINNAFGLVTSGVGNIQKSLILRTKGK